MFRYLKLFIFSIFLFIILVPTWVSVGTFYDYKFGSWPPDFFKDYKHLVEGTYDSDDEIRIIKQFCIDNDNFGRSLSDCIDSEFHVFVGQVGYWLPWDPVADHVQNESY